MFRKRVHLVLAGLVTTLLASCGGGGGSNNPPANLAPTASAGPAQTVTAGATITLNGTASSDPDGSIASYAWTQTLGTAVTLSSSTAAQPTFVAPAVATSTQLRFSLVVTDNDGASSMASLVTVTVNPAGTNVIVTGTVRFQRVPLTATPTAGLKFGAQVYQPARGVVVQAENAAQTILATTTTDGSGNYSLEVPGNTSITIRAIARMLRDGSEPLPRWDVRVQNGFVLPTAYFYSSAAFNSNQGTQDIDIPSGLDAVGTAVAPANRPSGPFAILDTLYTAIQAVVAVEPAANFPAFYVDWGSQNAGTFFTTENGQHIALMGDLTEDSDEFDQHVVAHEFGHYIEHNFSRSDSVGGPHGMGDRLDMRVAFGEGFGYGFAAIVLNDRISLDSFYNGSHVAGGFDVEVNPPSGVGDGPGCWCSESTVWSFLWDLADPATGGDNDGIAIGLEPIWQVMTGAQRTTPALTSIFSFVTALKEARPAEAALIDARMALNNIVGATMDAFATTETNAPDVNILPLYITLAPGTPAVAFSTGSIGDNRYNKAGNRRFFRYSPAATGAATVSLTSSNPNTDRDPDFIVFRQGDAVAVGWDPPAATETESVNFQLGQTYIIDAYECGNGCAPEPPQGTPGDYNLTVTIN